MTTAGAKAGTLAIQVASTGTVLIATMPPAAIGAAVVIVAIGLAVGVATYGYHAGRGKGGG